MHNFQNNDHNLQLNTSLIALRNNIIVNVFETILHMGNKRYKFTQGFSSIHHFIQTLSLAKKLAHDCYVQAYHHKVHVPAEIMTTKDKDKIQYFSKSVLEILQPVA